MQPGQTGDLGQGRRWDDTIKPALAALSHRGESLEEVAHDARNMVTALGLYCDLLEEPGVLAVPFAHYGNELRLVVAASRRLVEKLVALDAQVRWEAARDLKERMETAGAETTLKREPGTEWSWEPPRGHDCLAEPGSASGDTGDASVETAGSGRGAQTAMKQNADVALRRSFESSRPWETAFAEPVRNLAAAVVANHSLLSALAGPGIAVHVDTEKGARPVRLSAEDLTRLLVNLVKNAAEAMPSGGHIRIGLDERSSESEAGERVAIVIEDTGPGIPPAALERIFDSGFTTHPKNAPAAGGWPTIHRGLGLAISRAIVESSGGHITASNRPQGGACFEIELPVRAT